MPTAISEHKLDPESVKEKLREFGFANKCPMSGHTEWSLASEFVTVVPYKDKEKNIIFNPAFPAVMLACNGCGYMALFSAIILGLVDRHEEGVDE